MVAESHPDIEGSTAETALASVHPIAPMEPGAPDDIAAGDIAALLAGVRDRGFVTTGEIFAALPDLEPETAELAAIYANIRASGVQVVDEIVEELKREDERRAGRGGADPEPVHEATAPIAPVLPAAADAPAAVATPTLSAGTLAARRSRAAERLDRPPMETGSFDPVRMYLKEIGKVPLLTGPQEVTLAMRIEAGLAAGDRLHAEAGLSDGERSGLEAVEADGCLA